MPAAVIPFPTSAAGSVRNASWSLLEVAQPGKRTEPLGILLVDHESNKIRLRLRPASEFDGLEEQDVDILEFLADDLNAKAAEMGASEIVSLFEDTLSHFLRMSDRASIQYAGDPGRLLNRLFEQHVGELVKEFETHLPLYSIRAAATRFGEDGTGEQDGWVAAPPKLRLTRDMFVVRVVGRSMEPLIPDNSLCVFRANVTGTRQGKRLLIEQFGERSDANRYTVKVYNSAKHKDGDSWKHGLITLSPLNRDFEAFELRLEEFRVIGEFVTVLDSD